ncbi:MAG: hypothetical protein KBA30_07385 [Clostridia bacterium]|nr:hypothetical protein [Clostridia bacterium]
MTRPRSVVMELLRNLLFADLGLGVILFGQYWLSGGTPAMLRALLLVPLFFLTIPLRGIRHRLWKFLLPCVAYFLLVYLVGRALPSRPPAEWLDRFPFLPAVQRVLFAMFAGYALVLTAYERFTKPAAITIGYLIASEMLFFFLYLNAPADSPLRVALHFLAVFHLVFFVIHMQMENFASAMFRYAESGKQPVDRISNLGNRMLAGFLVSLGAVALFAPYGAAAFGGLLRGLLAVVRFFGGLLSFDHGQPTPTTTAPVTQPTEGSGDGFPIVEPNAFMRILTAIIETVLTLLLYIVGAAIIAGLLYLLYRLYRRFYADRSVDGDVRIRLSRSREDHTRIAGTAARPKRPRGGWGASPAERIRRIFVRTVEGAVKSGRTTIRNSDTAGIIADKVARGVGRDMDALAALYDKARYGPEGSVTKDDASNAKGI